MPPDAALALIVSAGLALVFGVWFRYEQHERLLDDSRRIRTVFHCAKCGLLYTRPRRRAAGLCPHCGHNNIRLRF